MRPFLEPFHGKIPARPPVWFMRQAGRYLSEYRELRKTAPNFLSFCYSPDLTVEATLQPIRRYGFDAAIMFSDILVIPDALGQNVRFEEGVGPLLDSITDRAGISALNTGGVLDHLAPVFETLTRLRRELPDETALIGFAGAPWTLAFYMIEGRGGVDGGKLKRMAYGQPEDFAALMAVLVALETWMGAGIDDPHAVNFCAMKQAMKHARSLIETPDTQPTPQPSP